MNSPRLFRVLAVSLAMAALVACSDSQPSTAGSDASSDLAGDSSGDGASPDVAADVARPDVGVDVATPDVASDVITDASPPDAVTDASPPDVVTDASPPDVIADVAPPDASPDVVPDVAPDLPAPDVAMDVAMDAASDAAPDVVDVACPTGQVRCDGACVDTSADPSNCGACGARCCAGILCATGRCVVTCAMGLTLCGSASMGTCMSPGTCTDTQRDSANCGACGMSCASGQVCDAGVCVTPCTPAQTRCGSTCVNTQTDASHCGACGRRCCAGNICSVGTCVAGCSTGLTACPVVMSPDGCTGSTCNDLRTDNNHCGRCDTVCGSGQTCVDGACVAPCAAGETRCGSSCVNTQSSDAHCGACGTACPTNQHCAAGTCRLPRSCDELLAMAPGTPSGTYTIDADAEGALAPFRVYCDMATDGGGWTLIAASAGATNMPRFDTVASPSCESASPTTPCFVGAAQLAALGLVEYRWSTTAAAVDTRAPLDNWRAGAADVSATCANANEFFRTNQDIATQGMAWSGCHVSEVYASTDACNVMYRPVWNLQRCEGQPISPGTRSSPDFNCSPFGRVLQSTAGGMCEDFFNVRHWRRGRTCPTGTTYCDGACINVARDASNCGRCGVACAGTECVGGACTLVRSCNELLRAAPGTPSGMYTIDTDGAGPNAPLRVYCDMSTNGGGWTLVAAAVGGTNMPRFTEAPRPCNWSTPNAPCVLGQSNIAALPYTEFAWSTTPTADDTRTPLTSFTYGSAEVNATCANANEYFRCNQDIASQGMGWTGCTPTEVYASTDVCNTMFRPVWNLLTCAGLSVAPGPRSSPDYNCSPFGANLPFGGSCAAFYDMRHWRR